MTRTYERSGMTLFKEEEGELVKVADFAHGMDDDMHALMAEPELLEALEALTQWVGRGIADGAYDNCVAPSIAIKALDRAEALIRKARGGQ